MDTNELNTEFRRFLDNEMPLEDHLRLQERLENEEALFAAFEAFVLQEKVAEHRIKANAEAVAREALNGLPSDSPAPTKPKPIWLYLLGGMLLLGLLYWLFSTKNTQPASPATPKPQAPIALVENQYLKNRNLENDLIEPLQSLGDTDQLQADIILYIQNEDYKKANETLSVYNKDRQVAPHLSLLYAYCLLKMENYKGAEALLLQEAQSPNVYQRETAEWMLALTMVLNHENEAAKVQLEAISAKANHAYRREAEELLGAF